MSAPTIIGGNLHVKGTITAEAISLPDGTVDDDAVASSSSDPISAEKFEHVISALRAQEATANAAAETYVVHAAEAAGSIESFECGLVTPPDTASGSSGRTATFDLKKNGTTVLTGTVVLESTNVAYIVEAGTIASSTYVDGDVFTIVLTVGGSAGTHAKGVFAKVRFHEKPV